jgi:alkylhydroperoxidase family enzyme
MARIANVKIEEADKYITAVLEAQRKAWGAPLLNHLLYARRPTIFRGARAMWGAIEESGLVDASLRALINRRVAFLNGCEF